VEAKKKKNKKKKRGKLIWRWLTVILVAATCKNGGGLRW
jgi:flagellar basal body-associated protein FliL